MQIIYFLQVSSQQNESIYVFVTKENPQLVAEFSSLFSEVYYKTKKLFCK